MTGDERIMIVGAGPAGLSCAESYRDSGGRHPVLLIGDDAHPPYERPALSKKLLRGETGADDILLTDEATLADRGIELRTGVRAIAADPADRSVRFDDGSSLTFGHLVLATGAQPVLPGVPGEEHCHTLRRVEDATALRAAAEGRNVLVVGSGFIGCEAAVSLTRVAASVTACTAEEAPLADRVGDEVAAIVTGWLEEEGVTLRTGLELSGVTEDAGGLRADFGDHSERAGLVLLALGIERRLDLAGPLGLELAGDGIATDRHMRTSVPGVMAAGDVAAAHNGAAGRRLNTEHWGDALAHGSVAGTVLAGDLDASWDQAPGFWSSIGERTVKQVGWGDGFDHVEVTHHADGGFTARYGSDGKLVAVLAHEADEDYERGREQVESGMAWP